MFERKVGVDEENSFQNDVIQGESKKSFNLQFQHHQDFLEDKKFCNINYSHSAISEQVLKLFGQCQNCQNLIFEQPY